MHPEVLSHDFLVRLERFSRRLRATPEALQALWRNPAGEGLSPEVEEHRNYSPGDDPRYIDWNVYARWERFMIKTVVREDEGLVHLLLDVSTSMSEPTASKGRRARQVAATLAHLALCAGARVAVSGWADGVVLRGEPCSGAAMTVPLLRHIARIPSGGPTRLARSLGQLTARNDRVLSHLVVVSDFIDARDYGNLLQRLRASGVRVGAVQILTPEERAPSLSGSVELVDPETGEQLRAMLGYRARQGLQREVDEFIRETAIQFAGHGGAFASHSSAHTFETIVSSYLSRRYSLPAHVTS